MRNKQQSVIRLVSVFCLIMVLSGCTPVTEPTVNTFEMTQATSAATATVTQAEDGASAAQVIEPEAEDRDVSYNLAECTDITITDQVPVIKGQGALIVGTTITITEAGDYRLSGNLSSGQLIVAADQEAKVHLIFDGLSIENTNGPALWVKSAEKVIVTLVEGSENALQEKAALPLDEDEDMPDAALYSQEDLSINGGGSLNVLGRQGGGIKSKDSVLILGGDLEVTAKIHAISAKDAVGIYEGRLTLTAGKDGVNSGEQVVISGGNLDITAEDDAIHSDLVLMIMDGQIDIRKSYEGLEAETIIIQNGQIDIKASDDGINASAADAVKQEQPQGQPPMQGVSSKAKITISGGRITVQADGDGIDTNGSIVISGGMIIVSGPTTNGDCALDYDGQCLVTGGTFAIAGSAGMAQAPSPESTQASLMLYFTEAQASGQLVSLMDDQGEVLMTYQPEAAYSTLLFSSPKLVVGEKYTFVKGGTSSEKLDDGFASGGTIEGGETILEIALTERVTAISQDGTAVSTEGGHGGMKGVKPPFAGQPPVKR